MILTNEFIKNEVSLASGVQTDPDRDLSRVKRLIGDSSVSLVMTFLFGILNACYHKHFSSKKTVMGYSPKGERANMGLHFFTCTFF